MHIHNLTLVDDASLEAMATVPERAMGGSQRKPKQNTGIESFNERFRDVPERALIHQHGAWPGNRRSQAPGIQREATQELPGLQAD